MIWLRASAPVALGALITVIGCNSANVIKNNMERSAQNRGQPKERAYPVHPMAPATSPTPRSSDQPLAQDDPVAESDDEVIQVAAQYPVNGPAPRSQVP